MDGFFVGWVSEVDLFLKCLVSILNKTIDNPILINIAIKFLERVGIGMKPFKTDPKLINKHKIILPLIENTIPKMILLDNLVIFKQVNEQGLASGAVSQHDNGVFVLEGFEHVEVVGEEGFGRE